MSDERAHPSTRPLKQDKEDRSKRLLEQLNPVSWQIRPITERDVGIDSEAEIRVNNQYTGLFFKHQLKSTVALSAPTQRPTKGMSTVASDRPQRF